MFGCPVAGDINVAKGCRSSGTLTGILETPKLQLIHALIMHSLVHAGCLLGSCNSAASCIVPPVQSLFGFIKGQFPAECSPLVWRWKGRSRGHIDQRELCSVNIIAVHRKDIRLVGTLQWICYSPIWNDLIVQQVLDLNKSRSWKELSLLGY